MEHLKHETVKRSLLVKLCNKAYGFKSHRQRIELDRERETECDIRIATSSCSASDFLKQSETE